MTSMMIRKPGKLNLLVLGLSLLAPALFTSTALAQGGGFTILGDYNVGPGGTTEIEDAALRVGGNVNIAIDDVSRFDLSTATLQLIGIVSPACPHPPQCIQEVEVLAEDGGECGVSLPDTALWSIAIFRIGPTATPARLVDNHDNDSTGNGAETLYVDQLILDPGVTLDLNGFNLYYNTITPADPYAMGSNVTVINNGGALVQIPSLGADCNTNGIADTCDISDNTSDDSNTNGIPDECELQAEIVLAVGNSFVAPEDCVQPGSGTNETLIVEVRMQNVSDLVVGGQFFMQYDSNLLQFVQATPGDPPFTREIEEEIDSPDLGNITYLVGIEDNGTGTTADTVMARLYFTPFGDDCASTPLVTFRPNIIPTRLAGDNNIEVPADTVDLSPITIDGSAPFFLSHTVTGGNVSGACSYTVTFSSTIFDNCGMDTADVSVDITNTTSNAVLGPPTITWQQVDSLTVTVSGSIEVSAVENCPATVQVTVLALDQCGNDATSIESANVNDMIAPVVDTLLATGGQVDGSCQYTVTFTASISDNCFLDTEDVDVDVTLPTANATLGAPTITLVQADPQTVNVIGSVQVSDIDFSCPATVQVTVNALDDCGNAATTAQTTADVQDLIVPVVDTIAATGGVTDGLCQSTVTFSATITDNCFVDTADVTVDVSLTTGNAVLGTPVVNLIQTDASTVTVTGSVLVSDVQNCPATVRVTVDALDDCGNVAVTAQTTANVDDTTSPVVDTIASTGGSVDGSCSYTVTFSATVSDTCFVDTEDVDVVVTLTTGNAVLGTPVVNLVQADARTVTINGSVEVSEVENCPATIQVTVDALDDCGNAATTATTMADVEDDTIPVISALAVTGGNADASCDFTVTYTAMVTDNCFVDVADVTVDVSLISGNAILGTPNTTISQVDGQTVSISGSVLVSDQTSCPATVQVTVNASDDCLNAAVQQQASANVQDIEIPVITVPADVSVHSDAGDCQAAFPSLPSATATDNCDTDLTITFTRSDGKPNLLDPYAQADSPITITWMAEDNCGNTVTDTQVITVSDQNEILVDVELSPTLEDVNGPFPGGTLERCLTFNAWECGLGTTPTAITSQEVVIPVDGGSPSLASNVSVLVPCGFTYTCMTARDRLHTLRSTAPDFSDDGATYSATFVGNRGTGGHWLVGGNLNDDAFIDILDFGSFVIQFQNEFDSDGDLVEDGNTTCSTPFFHPDISGDGQVFTEDFTFIQINILEFNEPNCCGVSGLTNEDPRYRRTGPSTDAPIMSISVSDLWRHGMGDLAAADLNRDGVLDVNDMNAFSEGNGLEPVVLPDEYLGEIGGIGATENDKLRKTRR